MSDHYDDVRDAYDAIDAVAYSYHAPPSERWNLLAYAQRKAAAFSWDLLRAKWIIRRDLLLERTPLDEIPECAGAARVAVSAEACAAVAAALRRKGL